MKDIQRQLRAGIMKVILVALLLGTIALPGFCETFPLSTCHIERRVHKAFRGTLSYFVKSPNANAQEWFVVAPVPPNLPSQTALAASISSLMSSAVCAQVAERSDRQRPILSLHIPVTDESMRTDMSVVLRYEDQLFERKLVAGQSNQFAPEPRASLQPFLVSSESVDFTDSHCHKWLDDRSLWRLKNERDVESNSGPLFNRTMGGADSGNLIKELTENAS